MRIPAALLLLILTGPGAVRAQVADSISPSPWLAGLVTPGSIAEDRIRLAHLVVGEPRDGFLIRSTSTLTPGMGGNGVQWVPLRLRTILNSDLPYSINEGSLWAGRGLGTAVSTGVRASFGAMHLALAPELAYQENRHFQIAPYPGRDRSGFASPWHAGPMSADLPLRFGSEPLVTLSPGQSSLRYEGDPVTMGLSTESQWWGPGIRNAIVLSNNAPGFPHLFLGTSRPLHSRIGDLELRWMVGGLTESLFFDADRGNDLRSLSGLVLAFHPTAAPGLSIGASRTVYDEVQGSSALLGRAFDVFTEAGRPEMRPDSSWVPGADQLFSLFGRWVLPASGVEVYAEWARRELPTSVRDWLVAPNHTQGYTVGAQWTRPTLETSHVRLQTEFTNLEQSSTLRHRRADSYYASRSVPHGYTHQGRVLGAAIGPGASSQWIALDWLASRWQAGLFAGRVRWENDAYYRQPTGVNFLGHDVSFLGGIRGAGVLPWGTVSVDLTSARRYNYLFQNWSETFYAERAVDVMNHTLSFTLSVHPF